MRHVSSRFILALFILVTGCVTYQASRLSIPEFEKMPVRKRQGFAEVAADSYSQPNRQKAVFDADFGKIGALAIRIIVRNKGDRGLIVRSSEVSLKLPDGQRVGSVSGRFLATKAEDPEAHRTAALVGGFGGTMSSSQARGDRSTDYFKKALKDVTLWKNDFAHGFVYFIFPDGTPAFSEALMTVQFFDVKQKIRIRVEIPLKELNFKGVARKTKDGQSGQN